MAAAGNFSRQMESKQQSAIDFDAIKQAATGRWPEIIATLTPLTSDVLTKGKSDHPCPVCNGKSVIWPAKDGRLTGSIACRKCTDNRPTGDGVATIAKFAGLSQGDAARAVAEYLGIGGKSHTPPVDLIEQVCRDKRMPREAFEQFEPVVTKRGRNKADVVRVETYNERGEKESHYDFVPKQKGFCAYGKPAGMFFPGRLPQPGETWLIVEGANDASALIGLGHNACGLPTCVMADKFSRLFTGVHVVIVPDLDTPGQSGSQKTGGRLVGIAASVRVARLPGEIVESSGDDVRDVLRRENGTALVQSSIDNAELWQPREGEIDSSDGRPEVLLTLAYGWVCDKVTDCLGNLGWQSPWIPAKKRERLKLYQRGGQLVQVVVEPQLSELPGQIKVDANTARIRPLPIGQVALRIADACQLVIEREVEGEIETTAAPPPRWLIDGVATRGEYENVKQLAGIVVAPTLRADGSILQSPGYDDKSGLLYRPSAKFPKVPENPSRADAVKAVSELLEVIKDFPFVDDADRSAWLALVLSLIGRSAIAGCVPMFTNTATTRGSGKSLSADAASLIAYGKHAARKTYTTDDNEQRKAITATALEALPCVLLDNIDAPLGGAALDAALTALTWTDRVLGSSATTGELPLRTVWIATGNNLRLTSDIARRVLPIRLASPLENPEERTDVTHPDLLGWVAANRPRLAVAALTVLRAYVVAGRPKQAGGTWGSFEDWSNLVRGSLVWVGMADPLATRETAKAEDQSGGIVAGLIGGLLEVDEHGDGLTVREIVNALNRESNADRFPTLREVVGEVATTRGAVDQRRLGYQLRKYRGRVAKGWVIASSMTHGGVMRWFAERTQAERGGDGGDAKSDPHQHPHHSKPNDFRSESGVGGDGWDTFQSHKQSENDVCSTHTHTHGTHTVPTGNTAKPSPTSPPSQPVRQADCFHDYVDEPAGGGKIRTSCKYCGKFYGYRDAEVRS
jgi:hypothetical protein